LEATLAQFTNGHPSAGTLTIDDDANGRGWFIDTTPWENSEFAIQNSEYSAIATPDSEAYGRYDLLTTILHELGHLQGILTLMIDGLNIGFTNFLIRSFLVQRTSTD